MKWQHRYIQVRLVGHILQNYFHVYSLFISILFGLSFLKVWVEVGGKKGRAEVKNREEGSGEKTATHRTLYGHGTFKDHVFLFFSF